MSELPRGWFITTLGNVLKVRNGYAFKSTDFVRAGVPLIRQTDLSGRTVDLSRCVQLPLTYLEEYKRFTLTFGDILIGMSGSIGKICIYDKHTAALQNQRTGKIEWVSPEKMDERYVWHLLCTVEDSLKELGKGVAVANVSATNIESLTFPMAPRLEQKRIANKLDTLIAKLDACRERLDRVPQFLKRFREAVLEAAVSGRLTEEWRKDRANPIVAPTLKDVEATADAAAQTAGVKRWKRRKYDDYPELDTPACWLQGRVGDVSLHRSGVAYKAERFVKSGIQVVRLGNLYQGRLDLSRNPVFISNRTANDEEFLVTTGDILVSQTGTRYKRDYGNCVLIDSDQCRVLVNQRILCLSATKAMLPRFLAYCGNASAFRSFFFSQETGGVNQGNVGVGGVLDAPCPIPGLSEQSEIVRRVDELFARADSLDRRYKAALARVEKLTPSVLAKAFRGELVPQDPNDEPAEKLLERIRAEREAAAPVRLKAKKVVLRTKVEGGRRSRAS